MILLSFFVCEVCYNEVMKNYIYAGTYTGRKSEGIYRFTFEDGVLSNPELLIAVRNPKYITVANHEIYSLADFKEGSGAARISLEGEMLDHISYEERTSCFIAEKDNRIYTSNYHTGCFSVLENRDGKMKLVRTVEIQDGAGCHQVLLWKDLILVPSLFIDRAVIYDQSLNRKGSIHFNAGTGPRHGVFSHDGEFLYLVSELSNELFVIHTGDWEIKYSIPVLPDRETHVRDTAAIRLSEDGRYLYVSTRTKDVLSVIELSDTQEPKLKQCVSCGGKHPRDFILIDKYLICANRNSDEAVCFKINSDGTIGEKTGSVSIPEAVSLAYDKQ